MEARGVLETRNPRSCRNALLNKKLQNRRRMIREQRRVADDELEARLDD